MSDVTVHLLLQNAAAALQADQLPRAEQFCRDALQMDPGNAQAIHYLGLLSARVGQLIQAIELMSQSIKIAPDRPFFYNNLGETLRRAGRIEEAKACWNKALALDPGYAPGHLNMARELAVEGRIDEAASIYDHVLGQNPMLHEARDGLGELFLSAGKLDAAVALWRQLSKLEPGNVQGDVRAAVALAQSGRLVDAIEILNSAVLTDPNHFEAHANRGMALLQLGDLPEGLREFDWTSHHGPHATGQRTFTQSRWDGSPLSKGQGLLLFTENGFGDAIQFVRFVEIAQQRVGAGHIILQCRTELVRLFKTIKGVEVIANSPALPAFHVQCELAYLPVIFRSAIESVSSKIPYLTPYRTDFERFKLEIAALPQLAAGPRRKIGLVWAGSPKHRNDAQRSISPTVFEPLLKLKGAVFFNLQKNDGSGRAELPASSELIDWTGKLNDFTDTAALLANLDLLISVDTSIVHLAGAMGRRVWTLLPRERTDWRWLPGRDDSPWYPTMRLFRQKQTGDWDEVIARVLQALTTGGKAAGKSV